MQKRFKHAIDLLISMHSLPSAMVRLLVHVWYCIKHANYFWPSVFNALWSNKNDTYV